MQKHVSAHSLAISHPLPWFPGGNDKLHFGSELLELKKTDFQEVSRRNWQQTPVCPRSVQTRQHAYRAPCTREPPFLPSSPHQPPVPDGPQAVHPFHVFSPGPSQRCAVGIVMFKHVWPLLLLKSPFSGEDWAQETGTTTRTTSSVCCVSIVPKNLTSEVLKMHCLDLAVAKLSANSGQVNRIAT